MKNILVTGSSSGIGKAISDHLTDKGFRVIGACRHPQADRFAELYMDVTDDNSVSTTLAKVLETYGHIDVVINCAGIGVFGPVEHIPMDKVHLQMNTNYYGTVRVNNAVLPAMRKRKQGLIINMSSMGGLLGLPFQAHYSASKFALEGYAEALRMELMPLGINVVNVNPGDFKTPFTAHRLLVRTDSEDYRTVSQKFLAMYEHDESHGAHPAQIALLIEKLISRNKNYKPRYVVGKISQTLAVPIKRFLGPKWFEKLMVRIWRINAQ